MIKLRYHFKNESTDLQLPFDFQYGPEELEDGTLVEITPVNSEGRPIADSFVRSVILVNRSENGINWYSANFPTTSLL